MYHNYRYRPYPDYGWHDYPDWECHMHLRDYGPNPFVINIEEAAKQNKYFRLALWTGTYYQLTLMSIDVGSDIGLEVHPDVDQFIRIEQGQGMVMMGHRKDCLPFRRRVGKGDVIFIPAGSWHNLINIGNVPIKLYSIYAPPEHPHGTVHRTKEEAEMEDGDYL
ncbi:MAG: cupin domain-containing protein [Tissierellia bacterium]|nr:cupin domain-containing protein [Tissierellia bacterium]